MKPAYDQLGDAYADSSSVLIGDVDCTAEGKGLCEQFEVRGYPTIKYFTDDNKPKGEDYQGGRTFDALKEFVDETLAVKCLLDDTEGCSDKEKEFMAKWKLKEADEVKKQLERLQGMASGSMKAELKKWIGQRIGILKQL